PSAQGGDSGDPSRHMAQKVAPTTATTATAPNQKPRLLTRRVYAAGALWCAAPAAYVKGVTAVVARRRSLARGPDNTKISCEGRHRDGRTSSAASCCCAAPNSDAGAHVMGGPRSDSR